MATSAAYTLQTHDTFRHLTMDLQVANDSGLRIYPFSQPKD